MLSMSALSPQKPLSELPASGTPDRGHAVLSVYGTAFLMGAISVILPASSVVLRDALGFGDALYGALFLIIYGFGMAVALSNSWILQRWSLRQLFLTGLGLQVLTLICLAASPSVSGWIAGRGELSSGGIPLTAPPFSFPGYAMLAVGAALFGIGAGAAGITINTAAIEIFPRTRSGALAALHGSLGVGAALWPLVVSGLARVNLWQLAPLLLAVIAGGLALVSRRRPIIGLSHELVAEHGQRDVPRRLWLWSLAIFLYGICESALTAWVVIYLTEDCGASMSVGAGALTAFWLLQTTGRFIMIFITRRISPIRIAPLLITGMILIYPLVASCPGDNRAWFVYALAGLACSAVFPLLLGLSTEETPRRAPLVAAFFSAAVVLGLAVGGFGLGPLRTMFTLPSLYLAVGAISVLLLLLVLFLLFRHGKQLPPILVDSADHHSQLHSRLHSQLHSQHIWLPRIAVCCLLLCLMPAGARSDEADPVSGAPAGFDGGNG